MAWTAYRVVFRLRSPLHIGYAKLGNVHYARAYVTGRSIWGALTERMTRDDAARLQLAAVNFHAYRTQSESIEKGLAYTYFYLAEPSSAPEGFSVVWPWNEQAIAPFLNSYASTALHGLAGSALTGSLHETEMIVPQRSAAAPTYLMGYFFEHTNDDRSLAKPALPWRDSLARLQLGAERGYGWGWIDVETSPTRVDDGVLFGGAAAFAGSEKEPVVTVVAGNPVLAHARPSPAFAAAGSLEPVVGREYQEEEYRYAGAHVSYHGVCYAPGSKVDRDVAFAVKPFGLWEVRKAG